MKRLILFLTHEVYAGKASSLPHRVQTRTNTDDDEYRKVR
jgi:hypothetical protein